MPAYNVNFLNLDLISRRYCIIGSTFLFTCGQPQETLCARARPKAGRNLPVVSWDFQPCTVCFNRIAGSRHSTFVNFINENISQLKQLQILVQRCHPVVATPARFTELEKKLPSRKFERSRAPLHTREFTVYDFYRPRVAAADLQTAF